jgi:hypothetical protein
MTQPFTKLQEVLSDLASTISPEHWNESDAIEWAFQAARKIGAVEQLQPALASVDVASYRSDLPEDIQLLHVIAYKENFETVTGSDLEAIMRDIGLDNDDYYAGFSSNAFTLSEYRPLKLASSPFSLDILCDECENLNSSSEHTFSILSDMSIITSFETGSLCIAYYRFAKDCDGDYLVPDDADYIDALRSYILMRFWERRMNTKEEGSANLYQLYSTRWQTLRNGVAGKLKMPDISTLENIRQSRNRLMPHQGRWYRGYGNQREERLKF